MKPGFTDTGNCGIGLAKAMEVTFQMVKPTRDSMAKRVLLVRGGSLGRNTGSRCSTSQPCRLIVKWQGLMVGNWLMFTSIR